MTTKTNSIFKLGSKNKIPIYYYGIFFLAILTYKPIAEIINGYLLVLLSFKGLIVQFDYFYDPNFNADAFTAIGAVIGIIIPVFLSVYENALSGNTISKKYIHKHFDIENIAFILLIIISSLISRNNLYVFFLSCILTISIFNRTRKYFGLLFFKRKFLKRFIKENFEIQENQTLHFKESVDASERAIQNFLTCDDNIDYKMPAFEINSGYNVKKINQVELKRLIRKLISNPRLLSLKNQSSISTTHSLHQSNQTSEVLKHRSYDIKEIISAHITYGIEERFINIRFQFLENHQEEDIESISKELKEDLQNDFRNNVLSFSKKIEHNDIFSDFDKYLYSLLKQDNVAEFHDSISIITSILEDEKNPPPQKFYDSVAEINFRIFHFSDLKISKTMGEILLDYWETLLSSSTKSESGNFVRYAFEHLASGFRNNFFKQNDIPKIERILTNFYKFEALTPKYVYDLVNGVITVSISFLHQSPRDEVNSLEFLTFIKFLNDDFKGMKKYKIRDYKNEDLQRIIRTSDQGLILGVAYTLYSYPDLQNKNSYLKLVPKKNFVENIQDLYLKDEKWDMFRWRPHNFNRHGSGQGYTFSPSDFYKNFTIEFLKNEKSSYRYDIPDFTIDERSIFLFESIAKELQVADPENLYIEKINSAISKTNHKINQSIITKPIDIELVNTFKEEIIESYKKVKKFSDLFKSHLNSSTSDKNSLGIHTLLPKKYFQPDSNTSYLGVAEYGNKLALGENRCLTKDLFKLSNNKFEISRNDFFVFYLPNLLEKYPDNILVYAGKTFNFVSNYFNWNDLSSKFNKDIKLDSIKDKPYSHELSYKGINYKVFLIETDQLKSNYFFSFSPNEIEVNYFLPDLTDTTSSIGINNTLNEVTVISSSRAAEMVDKNLFISEKTDRNDKLEELQLLVSFKFFVSASIKTNKTEYFSYKLLSK